MHYLMTAYIAFPKNARRDGFAIRRATAVHVESGWELLTDVATITLPRNVKEFNIKDGIKRMFQRGDEVTIDLGYDGKNVREFTGYVTKVGGGWPVKLECEDEMWKLKQVPVNMAYSGTLDGLLKAILPAGMKHEASDIKLEKLKLVKMTVASVLSWLKDQYGIYSYFVDGKLISGKIYLDDTDEVKLDFNQNVKVNQLEYVRADELRIKVSVTSVRPDGSKLTVTAGDEDGQESKFEYYGKHTEAELKAIAALNVERLKVDGYQGTCTLWGLPVIRHGMRASLKSRQYPEQDGKHFIDKVVTDWDDQGFTRIGTLGKQAS